MFWKRKIKTPEELLEEQIRTYLKQVLKVLEKNQHRYKGLPLFVQTKHSYYDNEKFFQSIQRIIRNYGWSVLMHSSPRSKFWDVTYDIEYEFNKI